MGAAKVWDGSAWVVVGKPGASAYEVAVAAGFVGDEAAWLASLEGADSTVPGPTGPAGANGADGVGVPAGGTTGQVLAKTSATDYDTEWATPAATGSGVLLLESGDSVPGGTAADTIVFAKSGTYVQSYDLRSLAALPAGWTTQGTITGQSFDATGLTATFANGASYRLPGSLLTGGDVGTLEVHIVAQSTLAAMFGPILHDGTNGAGACFYSSSPVAQLAITVNSSWQYGGSFANAGGTPQADIWFRIRKSGTSFYVSRSTDGTSWTAETTLSTSVGTATALGIGATLASVTATIESIKWTRPAAAGGLQGWWDGSALQSFS